LVGRKRSNLSRHRSRGNAFYRIEASQVLDSICVETSSLIERFFWE
jgi:hypothetical protein